MFMCLFHNKKQEWDMWSLNTCFMEDFLDIDNVNCAL